MSAQWIWAQVLSGEAGRQPITNPPLVPYDRADGTSFAQIIFPQIPDPATGVSINQYSLCACDTATGAGTVWADLPPLDQAIWLYVQSLFAADPEMSVILAAGIPPQSGATQPVLDANDAAAFANAQAWLNASAGIATTTGAS